ncbi:MAG: hypothetical protein JEY91_06175 [Spirochaetaceae bacterium]|nr:hypothetical protein [Spirochaetaceae bacterium]
MTLAFTVTGICLLAIYSVYFLLNRKISQILDSEKILSRVDDEINSLILELNQTTERNILLVEDRIKTLSSLIKDSDKSIIRLNKELSRPLVEPLNYSHLSKKKNFILPENELVKDKGESDENLSEKNRILELFYKGFSAEVIASKTGASIGEVELIITLNSRKG